MSIIINGLTNPAAANFVQNSTFQVLSEGCLKAVGRPAFTLMDKTATQEERKYSATKEFLYQSLSMCAYFGLIFPIRNNSYKLLKHFPQIKDCEALKAKTHKEFLQKFDSIKDELTKTKIKGAQELLSILASGVILTMITPQLVNKIIHPIMEKMEEKKLDKNA
jgi:hypothetical protein